MGRKLYVGFKGKTNLSGRLVQAVSGERCLLTNSFGGMNREIQALDASYEGVILLGMDTRLKNLVKIERIAEKETAELSKLDLEDIAEGFRSNEIAAVISDEPIHYLCNEAYWAALRKLQGRAVLLHVPSLKNAEGDFIPKMVAALDGLRLEFR